MWYLIVALAFLASALSVIGECLIDIFDQDESWWNRRAAALWIIVCVIACLLWPLLLAAIGWVAGDYAWTKRPWRRKQSTFDEVSYFDFEDEEA